MDNTLYHRDFYAWLCEQAELLKAKRFDGVDWVNLVEEIEAMGRSEHEALESRFNILILHLLKWQFQPEKQSSSWLGSIREQRKRINKLIKKSPSLRRDFEQSNWLQEIWTEAVDDACFETGLPPSALPTAPMWSVEQMLDDTFLPQ